MKESSQNLAYKYVTSMSAAMDFFLISVSNLIIFVEIEKPIIRRKYAKIKKANYDFNYL